MATTLGYIKQYAELKISELSDQKQSATQLVAHLLHTKSCFGKIDYETLEFVHAAYDEMKPATRRLFEELLMMLGDDV
jgi:hypothetical protein